MKLQFLWVVGMPQVWALILLFCFDFIWWGRGKESGKSRGWGRGRKRRIKCFLSENLLILHYDFSTLLWVILLLKSVLNKNIHIKRLKKISREGGIKEEGERGEEDVKCEIIIREKRHYSCQSQRTDCIFYNSSNT